MTKKQTEAEKLLVNIEFTIDDFLNTLREDIDKIGVKKKHKLAIIELSCAVKRVNDRLWPRTGSLKW